MIDLEKLSASELDELIAKAAEKRAQMQPEHSIDQPNELEAVINPRWYITGIEDGTVLQICHPGHGWLSYIIPPAERLVLIDGLRRQIELHPFVDSAAAGRSSAH